VATATLVPGVRPHPGDPAWLEVRRAVLERDRWRCANCGVAVHAVASPSELDATAACVDHIVPIARGGWHSEENLQTLCFSHNVAKGNEVIDYRPDIVLRAELAEQIAVRGIDTDTPVRYRKRVPGRELRTEQVNIAVSPSEKAWLRQVFGSGRAIVDVVRELVDN
jgi:HNH endonuclease